MNPLLRWGGLWRTATCPRDTAADKERKREKEKEEEKESRQGTTREKDRIRVVRRVVARAGARLLLRFMRPLPSPLAQLSSRYNIVVYSEPRLRSVNHPYVSPSRVPPASLHWLGHPRNPLIFLTRRGRREREKEGEGEWKRERYSLASTFSISAPMPGQLTNRSPGVSPGNEVPFCLFPAGAVFDWETRVNSELFRRAVTCALMKPTFMWGIACAARTTRVYCDLWLCPIRGSLPYSARRREFPETFLQIVVITSSCVMTKSLVLNPIMLMLM